MSVCLCVPKVLANRLTDMVLLFSTLNLLIGSWDFFFLGGGRWYHHPPKRNRPPCPFSYWMLKQDVWYVPRKAKKSIKVTDEIDFVQLLEHFQVRVTGVHRRQRGDGKGLFINL